jgi:hypothetical protein
MRMGFVDRKIANPKRGRKRQVGESVEGNHHGKMSMKMLTSLKWGIMSCLSRWTFKCGGSLSQCPNLDHYGAAPLRTWVMSLSVGLGSTPSLTNS